MTTDADGYRSDILGTLTEAMAGPLDAGARAERLPITAAGTFSLSSGLWEPLVLVAPIEHVGGDAIQVHARLGTEQLPAVTFAPWTERAAFLPLFRPALNTTRTLAADLELQLSATRGAATVPVAELAALLELKLLSGSFGRLYYLLQVETTRVRRLLRQVENARLLSHPGGAEGAMLDRIGRELAVPRFSDRITTQAGQIVTEPQRESDAAYRRRLKLYRPFLMATRRRVERVLNDGHPAAAPRFNIVETDNPFSIALRLVSTAQTVALARQQRRNYQRYLRDTTLIDPSVDVPLERALPAAQRIDENQLRARLRAFLNFGGASRSLAPALARALDRAGAVASALGVDLELDVVRAQDDDAGSRWELGLAAELVIPTPAKLDELAAAVTAADLASIAKPAERGMVARLRASMPTGTPGADWWLKVAGLRTVHALSTDRLLVSHFSTEGLVIEGDGDLALASAKAAPFTTALLAANDATTNAALASALSAAAAGWPGGSPWTQVADADLTTAVPALAQPPGALTNRLRALGLATNFNVAHFRQALLQYPPASLAVLRLQAAISTALIAETQADWDNLGELLATLAATGAASAVMLQTAGGPLTLIVSSNALPIISANLAARRTSGFVWRALPVTNGDYRVQGAGSRGHYSSTAAGIGAIAVIGYARKGLTDPFEYRVTAADDVELDIEEYELLMNTLRHLTPAGVQANTWDIRRSHVVIDPALGPSPLPVKLTRAFRPFRRRRFVGVDAPPLPDET